jgi:hypothetical protein
LSRCSLSLTNQIGSTLFFHGDAPLSHQSKPHVGDLHQSSARLSARRVLARPTRIPIKNARLGGGESDIQLSPSIFPPLMANGRTNAEDSGPEGAPESFLLGADPNSHRSIRPFCGAVCVRTGAKAALLFELPKTTWLKLQILFGLFLYGLQISYQHPSLVNTDLLSD